MPEPTFKEIAWGYTARDIGNGKEILVAERYKKDDLQREGQLVIPGGERKKEGISVESYLETAERETFEETGIKAVYPKDDKEFDKAVDEFVSKLVKFRRTWNTPLIEGEIKHGMLSVVYKDSKKAYEIKLIRLKPEDSQQNPDPKHVSSDTRNPRYIYVAEAMATKEKFTPACQIGLEILKEADQW